MKIEAKKYPTIRIKCMNLFDIKNYRSFVLTNDLAINYNIFINIKFD